jgi:hypothetical protein
MRCDEVAVKISRDEGDLYLVTQTQTFRTCSGFPKNLGSGNSEGPADWRMRRAAWSALHILFGIPTLL